MLSITKDVDRSFLINKVLFAIRVKWPRQILGNTSNIQQGNAKSHIHRNNGEFLEALKMDGFDIQLMCQPLNSTDLNILGLEFFAAIQPL